MKKLLALFALVMITAAQAGTIEAPFTRWRYIDVHTITLHGSVNMLVKMQYCIIQPTSRVEVFSDKVTVDGTVCEVQFAHRLPL